MKTFIYKTFLVLLCACLLLSVTGCAGQQPATNEEGDKVLSVDRLSTGEDFVANGTSQGMDLVAQNSKYQLLLNPETSTTAVYVKDTGYLWKSNLEPDDTQSIFNEDVQYEYMSQLLLSYFDSSSKEIFYDSYRYAVLNHSEQTPTIRYYALENGVRIAYDIGQNVDYTLMPAVLTQERMEELTSQMSEEDADWVMGFYEELIYDEMDKEVIDSNKAQYRNFSSGQMLYILATNSRMIKQQTYAEYLQPLGVTREWVEAVYEEVGYTFRWPEAPRFIVPVDFTLTDRGLTVNVPMDQVLYDTKTFRLYSIRVLPFFGAVADGRQADLFVPDGGGALVDSQTSSFASVSLPFYGADNSVWTKEIAKNMQQAALPAFGLTDGTNAFVAYVSDGESVGAVECHPKNNVYPFPYIGSTYTIYPFETFASNGASARATMQKYASDPYLGNITLNYFFLSGENVDYVDMAKVVREYLFADREKVADDSLRFYFGTYGMVLRKENFLGYAYNKSTALTTFEQAREIYDYLNDNGIDNVAVRYNNWYADGYVNKLSKIGSVSGVVGGADGMRDFMAYVSEQGGIVYPNMELIMEKNSTSLTDATWHSKYIEGTMISYADNEHWSQGVTADYERLVVKSEEALKKLPGILTKMDRLNAPGIALSTLGGQMFSDFTEHRVKYRDGVQEDLEQIMQQIKQRGNLLVDTGNAYTLPYADDVLDVSLSCSNLSFEKKEIPFMQIVLHGYTSYAGNAMNLSDNYDMQLLKSVEYGANLYYILNYAQAEMVKYTNYSELYSTNFQHWREKAVQDYQAAAAVLDGCQSSTIEDHVALTDQVFLTVYENGTGVLVNYGSSAYTYQGTSVPARGFARVRNA